MRTSEYISKFFTDEKLTDQRGLLLTLNAEFLIRLNQFPSFKSIGDNDGRLFEKALTEIRTKFTKISNALSIGLNEGLWKFFFANFIVIARDEYFNTYSKNKFIVNRTKKLKEQNEPNAEELAKEAYSIYEANKADRSTQLSVRSKYLLTLCDEWKLSIDELSTEDINNKFNKLKSQLAITNKKNIEYLQEVRVILLTYLKYK